MTTRPSPDSRSASYAARTTLNGPLRFVSMSFRHSSSPKRSARWIVSTTPALATTASQPPSRSMSAATPASTAARSRTSKSSTSHPATAHPHASSSSTTARPMPPPAPVTMTRRPLGVSASGPLEAIALPVAIRDVGRVLVPVPGTRIVVVVLGRVARVDRVAEPLDREDLVHERAVGAVDGEALAPVGPVVLALHHGVRVLALVAPHPPQALARAARVHAEGDLLVVLRHGERARLRPRPAARVRAPRRREQLGDLLAPARVDRLDAALPVALHRPPLRLADRLLATVLLHPRHRRGDAVDHHVVQEAPLVLHRLAQRLRALEVARFDRLDRAVHRRARHLRQLVL